MTANPHGAVLLAPQALHCVAKARAIALLVTPIRRSHRALNTKRKVDALDSMSEVSQLFVKRDEELRITI